MQIGEKWCVGSTNSLFVFHSLYGLKSEMDQNAKKESHTSKKNLYGPSDCELPFYP